VFEVVYLFGSGIFIFGLVEVAAQNKPLRFAEVI
jgi:hypothetical protein